MKKLIAILILTPLFAFGQIPATTPTKFQPLDPDLTAIAALNGTNTIYYRSAANTWTPVTIGTGLTFTGGSLSSSGATSDTAFASSWNGVTTISPSKNAVYDWAHTFDTDDDGKVNVLDQGAGIPVTDANGALTSTLTTGTISGTIPLLGTGGHLANATMPPGPQLYAPNGTTLLLDLSSGSTVISSGTPFLDFDPASGASQAFVLFRNNDGIADFGITLNNYPGENGETRPDNNYTWGYNVSPTGRQNTSEHRFSESIESRYKTGGGIIQLEHYWTYINAAGTSVRPFGQIVNLTTDSIETAIRPNSFIIGYKDTTYDWLRADSTASSGVLTLSLNSYLDFSGNTKADGWLVSKSGNGLIGQSVNGHKSLFQGSSGADNDVVFFTGANTDVDSRLAIYVGGAAAGTRLRGISWNALSTKRQWEAQNDSGTWKRIILEGDATTVGQSFFSLVNPSAITFPRINADNSVSALSASDFRTAIGSGTSSFDGAFTSLSSKPTTISGYGITDFNSLGDARWQPLDSDLTLWAATTPPSSYAIGDLIYASAANTLSKLADVATGNVLLSGGVITAPAWGKVTTSHTTGIAASGANSDITSISTLTSFGTGSTATLFNSSGLLRFGGATSSFPGIKRGTVAATGIAVRRADDSDYGPIETSGFRIYGDNTNRIIDFGGFSPDLSLISNLGVKWDASNTTISGTYQAALFNSSVGIIDATNGTSGQWGAMRMGTRDSGTNTITNGLTLGHQSTGTPAAGLGEGILFNLNSSTTADQNAGRIYAAWTTATHASRTSKVVIQTVNNAGALADSLTITPTGIAVLGTTTNDNAAAGNVGEYVSTSVVVGGAVALTTATPKTVTSISLTAGDWDITGIGAITGASTGTEFDVAIGTTTNSLTGTVLGDTRCQTPTVSLAGADATLMIPAVRVSISSTTTYYLIAQETFTIGSPAAYGRISARRTR